MSVTVPAWSSPNVHFGAEALDGPESALDNNTLSEPQRGRKRVRSPIRLTVTRSIHHEPSLESSTLRGRSRHWSNSPFGTASRNASLATRDRPESPLRQRHVNIIKQNIPPRSQCPSRSRSAKGAGAYRRRQRTRSRSQVRRLEGTFSTLEVNSPLQFEVLISAPIESKVGENQNSGD